MVKVLVMATASQCIRREEGNAERTVDVHGGSSGVAWLDLLHCCWCLFRLRAVILIDKMFPARQFLPPNHGSFFSGSLVQC